jgi:hypothetical protein
MVEIVRPINERPKIQPVKEIEDEYDNFEQRGP